MTRPPSSQPPPTDNADSSTEIIRPIMVRPQETDSGHGGKRPPYLLFGFACGVVLMILVTVAGWLWHRTTTDEVMPAQTQTRQADSPQAAEQPPQASSEEKKPSLAPSEEADEPKPDPRDQALAEQQLGAFLEAKDELDNKGVSQWGGDVYAEMIRLGQEADQQLLAKAYTDAAAGYAAAGAKAELLKAQMGNAFQQSIQAGQEALVRGDGTQAQKSFAVALRIDPQSGKAQKGLKRAENLAQVLVLIAKGQAHEKSKQFALAYTDYQQAMDLDPDSRAARSGLKRVEARLEAEQFNRLMSQGLTALHANQLELARAKLLEAKAFQPDSRAVQDALVQLDQAFRLAEINKLKQVALAAEQQENWAQSLKTYLAVLELDPNVQFAVEGRQRSRQHIRLHKRIDFFLARPDLLTSDEQLQNASILVAEAEVFSDRGPLLAEKLGRLKAHVKLAQTPIPVIIESDNLTEVAVYKVGQLGRFAVRQLDLRPGTYTVVGARKGYQDVRRTLTVKPGLTLVRITVVCTNRI